jgi:ATP-dependent DNA helicase PIF1
LASRGDSLQRWRAATHLVVDEVSMMDGRLFDALEGVARALRGSQAPFGGIQVGGGRGM